MPDARHIDRPAEHVRLALSQAQQEEMLRGIAGPHGGGLPAFLLARVGHLEQLSAAEEESTNGPRLSQSLLQALTILRFLSLAGGEQGVYEVARGVEGTPSTTRRYLVTLKQIGLVERSEETYKYRLATAPEKKARRRSSAVGEPVVRIVLCDAQVQEVLRGVAGSHGGGLRGFLLARTGPMEQLGEVRDGELPDDSGISRSLLRALMILRFLYLEGGVQQLYAIAPAVGLSHSTTHRYLGTLIQVGLVERIEETREYRLATDERS
jgi:predicted transcriptional regulator